MESLLDVFVGKKVNLTIDYLGKTISLYATFMGYMKPFLFLKVNGVTRAVNENTIKDIVVISD